MGQLRIPGCAKMMTACRAIDNLGDRDGIPEMAEIPTDPDKLARALCSTPTTPQVFHSNVYQGLRREREAHNRRMRLAVFAGGAIGGIEALCFLPSFRSRWQPDAATRHILRNGEYLDWITDVGTRIKNLKLGFALLSAALVVSGAILAAYLYDDALNDYRFKSP
ncbi:MAG: hypothetical protein HYT77_00515 [Deltaproteobacteria bacterium]|nr:hypothetical protein [Deltaproteobacteria bacterium]